MDPRTALTARTEELERVPATVFAVNFHTVHVCAGPGATYPTHVFCGARIRPKWHIYRMDGWDDEWTPCEACGEWVAELDAMTTPQKRP